jgi:DNA-directed RNA polymerase specialized sigma24 family protein
MNIDHLTSRDDLLNALRSDTLRGDILWDCRNRIVGYLRTQLPPEDVEDLASDCVEILQTGILEHWQTGKLSTFVISIARNKLLELFRKRKKQPINVSPIRDAQDESEDDCEAPLENLSGRTRPAEDHLFRNHPRLFSDEYTGTWQEILRLCDSLCCSPHEKSRLQELVAKMSITPEKLDAFLASEASGEAWPQMGLTSTEKALILRLFLRLEGKPNITLKDKPMADETRHDAGDLDKISGRTSAARFRAEVWRYWASTASQSQIGA